MDEVKAELIEKIIIIIIPIITAIIGFAGALILEDRRFKRMVLLDEEKRKKIVKTLFLKAFNETWKNLIKIIGIEKQLNTLGDPGRLILRPAQLENKKFEKLENCDLLEESEFYIISSFGILSEKVRIMNDHLKLSWADTRFHSLKALKKYVEDEKNIFNEYSLKFAKAIGINVNEFLKKY